jgi:hypothetical protein
MAVQNPFTGGSAGLSAVPEAYQPQALENLQQQRMAQLLMQQGMQPMAQGQMVGNHYVKASPYQNLASIANQALGMYAGYQADKGQIGLAKAIREGERSALADYMQTKEGRAAVPDKVTEMAGPYMGNIPMPTATVAGTPAIPANAKAAYANLFADPRASSKLQEFAFTKMNEGPMKIGVDDTLIDPNTFQPIYKGAGKTAPDVLTAAQMLGIRGTPDTWNPQQTAAVNTQIMAMKRAGAPSVSVNAANKFSGGFSEKASGGAYDMYTAAQNAPQQIENAKRTIELVNSGALTGPAANIGLEAAKIFNVAGANNQDTIAKTELLFSNRGKAMLGSIKQSGLAGSQGLTEGERKFLTQAEGGAITLNADTLKAMAGLEIKMAVQNQKKWNAQAGKMDKDILNATGAGPVEVYTGIGTIDASNPLLKR